MKVHNLKYIINPSIVSKLKLKINLRLNILMFIVQD